MEPIKDATMSYDQMAIVEKYEAVIAYLYPIAQNMPRKHGIARDLFLQCLLNQVQLFVEAGKSSQVSRLYLADAGISHLRFWLRFLSSRQVRAMTPHQCETAMVLLSEVGKFMGAWIVKIKRKGQVG
jgi:hypothetical protein